MLNFVTHSSLIYAAITYAAMVTVHAISNNQQRLALSFSYKNNNRVRSNPY